MKRLNALDWLALVLVVIGAVNWGLVGFFAFNMVEGLFGITTVITRVVYGLVGLAGVYSIYTLSKIAAEERTHANKDTLSRAA